MPPPSWHGGAALPPRVSLRAGAAARPVAAHPARPAREAHRSTGHGDGRALRLRAPAAQQAPHQCLPAKAARLLPDPTPHATLAALKHLVQILQRGNLNHARLRRPTQRGVARRLQQHVARGEELLAHHRRENLVLHEGDERV
jgi:hypothetical protein